eukprot:TRINITY_DN12717_c0_g1_i1.p1 TRINITY_DN12717_c0_g1~~TRINITY_DN12717_c0_g1_i1.p1  ORF type:complete len:615 (-),score=90.99 TRINITY_DN12717_c0_g1_i1:19-1863(-)
MSHAPAPVGESVSDEKKVELEEKEREREHYRHLLMQVDAVMEPHVLASTIAFIRASTGTSFKEVVSMLTQQYQGVAPMCNLLADWLELMGESRASVASRVKVLLQEFILQTFDPIKMDSIKFEPSCVKDLINDSSDNGWRELFYKLLHKYPNSCFLTSYVQPLLQQVASQNSKSQLILAAQNCTTPLLPFDQALQTVLEQFLSRPETEYSDTLTQLQKLCCVNQQAYIYSQGVLSCLAQHPQHGLLFRRISQDISFYAATIQECGIQLETRLDLLRVDTSRHQPAQQTVLSILRSSKLTSVDVRKLYDNYRSGDPPPVALLRQPAIFDLFLHALFASPGHGHAPVEASHVSKYLYLLAYATSVADDRETGGQLDRSALPDTLAALTTLQDILGSEAGLAARLRDQEATLQLLIQLPIVAAAVVYWIKCSLGSTSPALASAPLSSPTTTDASLWATHHSISVPVVLRLLANIASAHPLIRERVLEVVVLALEVGLEWEALAIMDLRKQLLRLLIHLIHLSCYQPVLAVLQQRLPAMDHSLIRFLITHLLESISPPYSSPFVCCLLDLFSLASVRQALQNEARAVDVLCQFLKYVDAHSDQLGVTQKLKPILAVWL